MSLALRIEQQRSNLKMNKIFSICLLISIALLSGCQSIDDNAPRSNIDLQAMQTRTVDCQYSVAFASVVSVFQDLGFTIQSADINTGLICAQSTTELQSPNSFESMFSSATAIMRNTSGTAHVESFGERSTSIRMSFVSYRKSTYAYGTALEDSKQVTDAEFYRDFFEKIDKAIFIRNNIK